MDHKIGSGARCAMIGYGSWATALAKVLTENEPSIGWYVRNPEVLESLRNKGRNPRYLSNVRFDRTRINPSDDRGRHRHPGQSLGLPEKDARNADRSAQGQIRHLGHQRHRPGRLHHRRRVYTRSLWPIFQATGHHHRPLPCRRGFARTALLPYGGLHRSGKFAYDRTQIRH